MNDADRADLKALLDELEESTAQLLAIAARVGGAKERMLWESYKEFRAAITRLSREK
jgi:transposase-like protein